MENITEFSWLSKPMIIYQLIVIWEFSTCMSLKDKWEPDGLHRCMSDHMLNSFSEEELRPDNKKKAIILVKLHQENGGDR